MGKLIKNTAIKLLLIGLMGGCGEPKGALKKEEARGAKPVIVAMVNQQPVYQERLLGVLYPAYGKIVLDELILTEVVAQEAGRRGVSLSKEMTEAERRRFMEELGPGKTPEEQEGLFAYMLESRGIKMGVFELILQRQALLRAMVDSNVAVTEEMLQKQFEQEYGKQVVFRQVVTSSFRTIEEIKRLLQEGKDFAELVNRFSEDQISLARGGLVGPVSGGEAGIPAVILDAAFKAEQTGKFSDILSYYADKGQQWWAIIRVEDIIAARQVDFERVRDELEATLKRKLISARMLELQQQLRKQAKVQSFLPGVK